MVGQGRTRLCGIETADECENHKMSHILEYVTYVIL